MCLYALNGKSSSFQIQQSFGFFLLSSCSTYIRGVKTTGNRVFVCCIGSEAKGLWTATMI